MSSRQWVMVDIDQQCGSCGRVIPPRTWYCEIAVPYLTRRLLRCEPCARTLGAPAPPDADWPAEAKPS